MCGAHRGGHRGSRSAFTPFSFHPIKASLWSPSIPGGKRCLRHYSKLLAVAIFMDLSLECSRKAIAVNSNWRPRGVRLDWISISQVHCFPFLPSFFPPSSFVRSEHYWHVTGTFFPLPVCQEQQSADISSLSHFEDKSSFTPCLF